MAAMDLSSEAWSFTPRVPIELPHATPFRYFLRPCVHSFPSRRLRLYTLCYIHGVSAWQQADGVSGCGVRSAHSPNYFIPGIYLLRNSLSLSPLCTYRDEVHACAHSHTRAGSCRIHSRRKLRFRRVRKHAAPRRISSRIGAYGIPGKKCTPYQFAKHSSPERGINRAVALPGGSKNSTPSVRAIWGIFPWEIRASRKRVCVSSHLCVRCLGQKRVVRVISAEFKWKKLRARLLAACEFPTEYEPKQISKYLSRFC